MFKNMKIGWRMGLGFSLVLVFMIALILLGLNALNKINKQIEAIAKVEINRTELANGMIDDVREVSIALRNIFLIRDIENFQEMKKRIAELRKSFDENLKKLEGLITKDDTKTLAMLSKIKAELDITRDINNKVIDLAKEGKYDDALDLLNKENRPKDRQLVESIDDLIRAEEERTELRFVESQKLYTSARISMLIIGAVAVALAAAMSILLALSITRPLKLGVHAANRIASGDLTVDLSTDKRRDEIGALIQSLSKMVTNLREQTREILDGANVLASSASEITTTVTQLVSSAQETAVSVSESTTTMEELRQTAKLSTEKANYVLESSQYAVKISDEGKKSMEETIEGMKLIKEQMASVAESIVRLSEQSQAIGDIISAVNDLADQSNLLSVNASIEAAKAGEQGKGFTVVAQEVKTLAEQSKQATAQVRTILNDIQKATSGAVMSTEQGSKAVDTGVHQADLAGASIEMLSDGVREAAQAAMQIAASSQQQLAGIDQVASAMESIKQVTTQNVAGSKQLETSATNLNELGQKLKQLVGRYKV